MRTGKFDWSWGPTSNISKWSELGGGNIADSRNGLCAGVPVGDWAPAYSSKEKTNGGTMLNPL